MTREKLITYSWFVGLLLLVLFGLRTYNRLQLGDAAYYQLLTEKNQALQQRQIQIDDQMKQRGMGQPPAPSVEEEPSPE